MSRHRNSDQEPKGPGIDASQVLGLLESKGRPMDLHALERALAVGNERDLQSLEQTLDSLTREGRVLVNRRGAFLLTARTSLKTGRVQGHPDGFGFLILDEGGDDIFLGPREMQQVFHGDRVAIRITSRDRRGRPQGEVAEVLERASNEVVGRLHIEGGVSFVVPSAKRQTNDLLIPNEQRGSAQHGQVVLAEITRMPGRSHHALGRVIEVIGEPTDPEMEIEIAVRTFGIPHRFPDTVLRDAEAFGPTVADADIGGRADLRDVQLVTIDGADARDFDDAVHAERTSHGWRLRVAIADVSHYVTRGSDLDQEAKERSTSVYFPRRVIPMLPEALSNGLCSLNPDVDRLALVCDMRLDEDGKVTGSSFSAAVIRSHARLTYETVQAIIDGDVAARQAHESLLTGIADLHALYGKLAQMRRKRGALDIDQPEPVFVFGADGQVSGIDARYRLDAHRIIEECMITANVAAAKFLEKHHMPALFRVHDLPDEDRVAELRTQAQLMGFSLGGGEHPAPKHLAKLLREIKGEPAEPVLGVMVLRTLSQAVYRGECNGHYGLALERYAHFTSPIRRYPDLLVHRAIHHVLAGGTSADYAHRNSEMEGLGQQCSIAERRADEASWDVQAWLRCRFMENRVGESFDARISGVQDFGIFVRLEPVMVEGMIHVSALGSDYYEHRPEELALVGSGSGRSYRLGDSIRVRCVAVRTDERKIDFVLADDGSEATSPSATSGRTRGSADDDRRPTRRSGASKKDSRKRTSAKKKSSKKGAKAGSKKQKNKGKPKHKRKTGTKRDGGDAKR
jgi:ribonuclease R